MTGARDLIILGGGEHARVVIETARSGPERWNVVGFSDPNPTEETIRRCGVPWLGDDGEILDRLDSYWVVLGFGGLGVAAARAKVVERFTAAGARWATLVHGHAWVSPTAEVSAGSVVVAGAVVNTGAVVGAHAVVNTGAVIEHDVRLGAFTQVGPGAALGGGAVVGDHCYLGLGCRVRDHVRIGEGATVGMGAVVVRDVAAGERVLGVPARPV